LTTVVALPHAFVSPLRIHNVHFLNYICAVAVGDFQQVQIPSGQSAARLEATATKEEGQSSLLADFFDSIPRACFTFATTLARRFFRRVLLAFTPVATRCASFFTGRRRAVFFLAMCDSFRRIESVTLAAA
jgi:hypothetical protein